MTTSPPPPPPINLMRGWPAPPLLPTSLILTAATTALRDPAISTPGLLYGPDEGYGPLRAQIATWLQSFYRPSHHPITPARICLSGGASQNLGCLLSVYTDPAYTRNVWVVAPAYFLAFGIFDDAGLGAKMRAVPEDADGVDVHVLRREMERSERAAAREGNDAPRFKRRDGRKGRKVFKHVIYCVPAFANPSARTTSLARRRALVRLARELDALVVCDDVYDFLQWPVEGSGLTLEDMTTARLPRMVDVDAEIDGGTEREGADGFGNVCSNGSFSKIAGPGMRAGWVEGTEKFAWGVSQAGTTRSGGSASQLTSTYLTPLLATGALQSHIHHVLRPAYAARHATLLAAITTHLLPLGFRLPPASPDGVAGGYFVWLALPPGLAAARLAARCSKGEDGGGVVVAEGGAFEVPGDCEGEGKGFAGFVRLCFSWVEVAELTEGIRRLAVVAGRMLEEEGEGESGFVVVESDVAGFK